MLDENPIEPFDRGVFTCAEVRTKLARAHGMKDGESVPPSTFSRWCRTFGLKPSPYKLYSQNQVNLLRSFARGLYKGLTVEQWMDKANAENPDAETPIAY